MRRAIGFYPLLGLSADREKLVAHFLLELLRSNVSLIEPRQLRDTIPYLYRDEAGVVRLRNRTPPTPDERREADRLAKRVLRRFAKTILTEAQGVKVLLYPKHLRNLYTPTQLHTSDGDYSADSCEEVVTKIPDWWEVGPSPVLPEEVTVYYPTAELLRNFSSHDTSPPSVRQSSSLDWPAAENVRPLEPLAHAINATDCVLEEAKKDDSVLDRWYRFGPPTKATTGSIRMPDAFRLDARQDQPTAVFYVGRISGAKPALQVFLEYCHLNRHPYVLYYRAVPEDAVYDIPKRRRNPRKSRP